MVISYECCKILPETLQISDLEPLKLNNIDVETLNIAQQKLNQYLKDLDKIKNQPPILKYTHWFTIFAIVLVIYIIVYC